jgi:uncharacterized membrane protein SirB2
MRDERDSGILPNRWNEAILVLVAAALLSGLGLSYLPNGPLRDASLWLTIGIGALMIVSAVGWGYVEIRNHERLSQPKSNRERIVGYLGALVVVTVIAVAAATVPAQVARVMWIVFVPIWLVGGWWLRRRGRRSTQGRASPKA